MLSTFVYETAGYPCQGWDVQVKNSSRDATCLALILTSDNKSDLIVVYMRHACAAEST